MKNIVLILLILIYGISISKTIVFDRCQGNKQDLFYAHFALEFITMNKPNSLKSLASKNFKIDSLSLANECLYTKTNFPYTPFSNPSCFYLDNNSNQWYERTYFEINSEGIVKYLFQIQIYLIKENDLPKILDIQFRVMY
ncbi:MAG: hypothetical protein H6553_04790 [Chitinophagales bacterium]|nr:hypothetical protein [Chitinophagales bacterium]